MVRDASNACAMQTNTIGLLSEFDISPLPLQTDNIAATMQNRNLYELVRPLWLNPPVLMSHVNIAL